MDVAFFESITPYWVDMHNFISDQMKFHVIYIHKEFQTYDTNSLNTKLNFQPEYIDVRNKNAFCFKQLYNIVKKYRPRNIITIEFSLLTLQLLLLRLIFRFDYKLIVRTDDSMDLIRNAFTIKNKLAKSLLSSYVDNFILCDYEAYNYYNKLYGKGVYFPIVRDEAIMRNSLSKSLDMSSKYLNAYNLNNKHVILFVGRLTYVKNVELLISAFSKLNNDNSVLLIIGDGELRQSLEHSIQDSNKRIYFLGWQEPDKLYAWYNIADIFVLPSLIEPFGAVVNEALIAGCYSLITNKAGSRHLISEGVNGNLFSPNNEEELINLIQEALSKIGNRDKYTTLKQNRMLNDFLDYASNLKLLIS